MEKARKMPKREVVFDIFSLMGSQNSIFLENCNFLTKITANIYNQLQILR